MACGLLTACHKLSISLIWKQYFSLSQVAALSAISNIVVDFATRRSIFIQCGGVAQLVQSSKSMDAIIRANALWALRNFIFQAEKKFKEVVFKELTASLLASLVCGNGVMSFVNCQSTCDVTAPLNLNYQLHFKLQTQNLLCKSKPWPSFVILLMDV